MGVFVILERWVQSKGESNQIKYVEHLIYNKVKNKNTWRNKKKESHL